jgi:hypothetical protein
MSTPPPENRCNRCQTPIPVDAPVPFCPPCIAAGALRQGPEGSDPDDRSGPNWPAIGLAMAILGILAVLIVQSIQMDAAAKANGATNSPSQTNPPPAPNPSNP